MIIPIVVAAAGVSASVAWWKRRRRQQPMTSNHQKIYNAAINGSLKDPSKLRALSAAFAGEGYVAQAKLLSQRAAIRELPKHIAKQRNIIFRRAMRSRNKAGVLHIASVYEKEGCTGAAARLREYASGLPNEPIPEAVEMPAASEPAPEEKPAEPLAES